MSAMNKFKISIQKSKLLIFSLVLLTFTFCLLTFTPTAFAQTTTPATSSPPTSLLPLPTSISPTSPIYTDLLVHNFFHTFSCLSLGSSIIGQPCLTYQTQKDAQGAIKSVPILSQVNLSGGLLGTTGNLIAALYMNPPVRTIDYLASVGESFGIVQEAHAQVIGSGQAVLNPILKLWQVSRNIAYLFMIIIFVVIGLMVMFRQRINPQTVITAQAALPGLVIGLILITFSYFFAALLTDTAFIGTNLVGFYFSSAQGSTQSNLVDKTANENLLTIMGKLMTGFKKDDFTNGVAAFLNALGQPKDFIELGLPPKINIDDPAKLVRMGAALAAYQIGATIGPAIGSVIAGITCGAPLVAATTFSAFLASPVTAATFIACVQAGNIIGGPVAGAALGAMTLDAPQNWIGFAVWILAILAIIFAMFRLLLRLINNFLSIIFLVITAPFFFLAASLPGRQGITTAWILNMLCNVLVFPAVMAVFYFINYLLGPIINSPFNVGSQPNFSPNINLPLFGGFDTAFIRILLAFGALITTPAIPDIICRTIGRIGVAGQLLGQELGAGWAGGRGYLGQAQGGFGAMQQGVTGLGQFPSTRLPILDANEQVTGYTTQAGLGGRLPKGPLIRRPGPV